MAGSGKYMEYLDTTTNQWVKLDAGNADTVTTIPALSGDAISTGSNNTVTLATTGVAAGTYTQVTVDTKGRVTSAGNIDYATNSRVNDLEILRWMGVI